MTVAADVDDDSVGDGLGYLLGYVSDVLCVCVGGCSCCLRTPWFAHADRNGSADLECVLHYPSTLSRFPPSAP